MKKKEFIQATIMKMDEECFEVLKDKLLGKYIYFSFSDGKTADRCAIAEKVYDLFDKITFRTGYKFDDFLKKYVSDWDAIVDDRIIKESPVKKDDDSDNLSRARKLYDRANKIRKLDNMSFEQLLEYSRMMMTLYMAIVNNDMRDISDFEYSFDSIDIEKMIEMMKQEKKTVNLIMREKRFDERDTTFVIALNIYYHIASGLLVEED